MAVMDGKKRMPAAKKRLSKCGIACPLKHLKSLYTFVLADFEQQLIPHLAERQLLPCIMKNHFQE